MPIDRLIAPAATLALATALAIALATAAPAPVQAAALRVSPVLIDGVGGRDATVELRNQEARPLNVQVRVFRWSQHDGRDELTPTEEVVASPPILSVPPGEDYTVRLQRVAGGEPAAEEAYRVVIDELPNPNRQRNGAVAMVLRYLVPAFFFPADAAQPRLRWLLLRRDGRAVLRAENEGDKRVQLVDLGLRGGGRTAVVQRGLAGYVLGHSAREWALAGAVPTGGRLSVVAAGDLGAIDVPLAR